MFSLSRRPILSLQTTQRRQLEAQLAAQKETLLDLQTMVQDIKEIKTLRDEVNQNTKEINALSAEIAGLQTKV